MLKELFIGLCLAYAVSANPTYVFVQSRDVYMKVGNGTYTQLFGNVAINLDKFDQITLHDEYELHHTNNDYVRGMECKFWMYKEGSDRMANVQSFMFTRSSEFYTLRDHIRTRTER